MGLFGKKNPRPKPTPRRLRREGKYGRLVVVCGMPRSGTSAFAAFLGTHPDMALVVGDGMWHVAESDLVRGVPKWSAIDALLEENQDRLVVVKQPGLEMNEDFLEKAEGARILLCVRPAELVVNSWSSTGWAGKQYKGNPMLMYAKHAEAAMALIAAGRCLLVRPQAIREGEDDASELACYLKVGSKGFDRRRIERRWGMSDEKLWLEEHAIWV